MRVNIKVATRSHRPAGARESVPQGYLIVAHYEVVGKGVKIASSGRDDRPSIFGLHAASRAQATNRSSLIAIRDGHVFLHHLPVRRGRYWSSFTESLPPSPRRRFAMARPSYCGRAVAQRAKAAFGLPTSPTCPQNFFQSGVLRRTRRRTGRDQVLSECYLALC
jgi:hypothetical protein